MNGTTDTTGRTRLMRPTRAAAFIRGLKLAEIRRAAGVRQVELAQALGVSQARISKIEHGEIAGIDIVVAYVAALGGTVDITVTIDDRTWKVS